MRSGGRSRLPFVAVRTWSPIEKRSVLTELRQHAEAVGAVGRRQAVRELAVPVCGGDDWVDPGGEAQRGGLAPARGFGIGVEAPARDALGDEVAFAPDLDLRPRLAVGGVQLVDAPGVGSPGILPVSLSDEQPAAAARRSDEHDPRLLVVAVPFLVRRKREHQVHAFGLAALGRVDGADHGTAVAQVGEAELGRRAAAA